MELRKLGNNGLQVSALGLGCMGMSFAYGPANEEESLQVLHRYLELGGNFLDTAEIYGPYKNEELLGKFLREIPRDSVVVATKFGFRIDPDGTRRGLIVRLRTFAAPATPASSASASTPSISTTSIASIPTSPSKKPSAPWPNSFPPAKSARSDYRKPVRKLCAAPPRFIPSPRCKANTRSGRATWKPTACSPPAANSVSPSFRTARSAVVFSPAQSRSFDDLDPSDWRRTNYPALPGRSFASQPETRRGGKRVGRRKRNYARAVGLGMGACARRGHGSHSRNKTRSAIWKTTWARSTFN